jgi:hypothetical protein
MISIASLAQRVEQAAPRARQILKASQLSEELSRQASFSLENCAKGLIIHLADEERKSIARRSCHALLIAVSFVTKKR